MNVYDFLDKYIEYISAKQYAAETAKIRLRINRILQKEKLEITRSGTIVHESIHKSGESSGNPQDEVSVTKLTNFCVIPTHRLYVQGNDSRYIEEGVGVRIYTKLSKKKYKLIHLNLSNEMIEKGNWLNANYSAQDLILYKKSFYHHVCIAIKLSTRALASSEYKVFTDGYWYENEDESITIDEYEKMDRLIAEGIPNQLSLSNNQESEKPTVSGKHELLPFLAELSSLIETWPRFEKGTKPSTNDDSVVWFDREYYYLPYKQTWSTMEERLRDAGFYRTNDKDFRKGIEAILSAEQLIKIETETKSNRERADCNASVYKGKKLRVFKVYKARLENYLQTNSESQ